MKVVILAGGLGSRISEESRIRPKPMVEIGGRPILWHIMKIYSFYGINEFIICCGYKGYLIKEFFSNYFLHMSDVTIDMVNNAMEIHKRKTEPWRVTLVDTGELTKTGGRLKRVASYIGGEYFCMTYGDGVGDINLTAELEFHKSHGRLATMVGVMPPGRFGALSLDGSAVESFLEKPHGDGGYVNGGFFVLSPEVIDLIDDDNTVWEKGPLEKLAYLGELQAFFHNGFWQPMDTLRDKMYLEDLWVGGEAPWKVWK